MKKQHIKATKILQGLRARGKSERRRRLREAARAVFLKRRYEGAPRARSRPAPTSRSARDAT